MKTANLDKLFKHLVNIFHKKEAVTRVTASFFTKNLPRLINHRSGKVYLTEFWRNTPVQLCDKLYFLVVKKIADTL